MLLVLDTRDNLRWLLILTYSIECPTLYPARTLPISLANVSESLVARDAVHSRSLETPPAAAKRKTPRRTWPLPRGRGTGTGRITPKQPGVKHVKQIYNMSKLLLLLLTLLLLVPLLLQRHLTEVALEGYRSLRSGTSEIASPVLVSSFCFALIQAGDTASTVPARQEPLKKLHQHQCANTLSHALCNVHHAGCSIRLRLPHFAEE